jgi:alkylation response protein AidB-like acyl-CoA dehydrogenase
VNVDIVMTEDQQLFCATTRRFLERECPLRTVRELARSDDGFERDYWRQGAELGWTSLLVPPAFGGGAITGAGVTDLAALAGLFGAHVAPGPLLPVNLVAAALARSGTPEQQADLLPRLCSGDAIAAWVDPEPAAGEHGGVTAARDGNGLVLDGVKTPVEAGAQADVLLVTSRSADGPVQVVVDAQAEGVTVTPLASVDLTRRYARVEFDAVRVPASACLSPAAATDADVEWQFQLAAVVQSAEVVGAAQVVFDFTLAWAFDRYTFGRPLASYQVIKHRFADMKLWLESGHAIAAAAATELDEQLPSAAETASVAKAYIADHLTELVQECVQMHGGIGLTYEHDIHLFLRRVVADRQTYGTPSDHRLRVTDLRVGAV